MTRSPAAPRSPGLPTLAHAALAALSIGTIALVPLIPSLAGALPAASQTGSPTPSVVPAKALLAAAPGRVLAPELVASVPVLSDVAALVARQRAAGLACSVTALDLPVCSHGQDASLGALPPVASPASEGGSGSTEGSRIGCYGNGTDGRRVQAVYARPEGTVDRYAASLPDLKRYAAGADAAFDAAAQTTGGRRHIRFATSSSCELSVLNQVLPGAAFASIGTLVDALQQRGLGRSATTYLVWTDAKVLCGIATMYVDDTPGLDNLNNGAMPAYARVDRPCWGKAEVHELVHTFGGVQPSAPHATAGYHCNDGIDVMCYDDGSAGSTQRAVCPASSTQVLDCRHDDYFSTAAPKGSYLQTRWNVARSSYLSDEWSDSPAPPPAAVQPMPTASAGPQPTSTPGPPASVGPLPALPGAVASLLPTSAPLSLVGRS